MVACRDHSVDGNRRTDEELSLFALVCILGLCVGVYKVVFMRSMGVALNVDSVYLMTQWLPFKASVACSSVISMDGIAPAPSLVPFAGAVNYIVLRLFLHHPRR